MSENSTMIICPVCGATADIAKGTCPDCGADLSMLAPASSPVLETQPAQNHDANTSGDYLPGADQEGYISGEVMNAYADYRRGSHAGYAPSSSYVEKKSPYTTSSAYAQSLYDEVSAENDREAAARAAARESIRTGRTVRPEDMKKSTMTVKDADEQKISTHFILTRIVPAALVVIIVLFAGLAHLRNTHRYPTGSWSIAQTSANDGLSVAFTVSDDGAISIRYGEISVPGSLKWTNPGALNGLFAFGAHDYELDWGTAGAIAQQYGVTNLPVMTFTTPYRGFTGRWALNIQYEGMAFSFDVRVARGGTVTFMGGSSAQDMYGSTGTWEQTAKDSDGATYTIAVEGSMWTVQVPRRFS